MLLSYLHPYDIMQLSANWAICCSVNCAFDYMRCTNPWEVLILSGNQSCWAKAVGDRLCNAHLSLVWFSHGSQMWNVQMLFFFLLFSSCLKDLSFVEKHTWGKFHHFMVMATASIRSPGDLCSIHPFSCCHYNPFVKHSSPAASFIGSASASKTLLQFTFISVMWRCVLKQGTEMFVRSPSLC